MLLSGSSNASRAGLSAARPVRRMMAIVLFQRATCEPIGPALLTECNVASHDPRLHFACRVQGPACPPDQQSLLHCSPVLAGAPKRRLIRLAGEKKWFNKVTGNAPSLARFGGKNRPKRPEHGSEPTAALCAGLTHQVVGAGGLTRGGSRT